MNENATEVPKNPAATREASMEDVHSIALAAMKVIEEGLKEHGIALTPEQEDSIYVPMDGVIEKVCGYPDYRNHN